MKYVFKFLLIISGLVRMPRSSKSTPRPVVQVPNLPVQHTHSVQQPTLFSSVVQGFGLGAGSSIARNIFESKPQQQLPQMSPIVAPDNKKIEFKQCMEKTFNNYDECVHHLE